MESIKCYKNLWDEVVHSKLLLLSPVIVYLWMNPHFEMMAEYLHGGIGLIFMFYMIECGLAACFIYAVYYRSAKLCVLWQIPFYIWYFFLGGMLSRRTGNSPLLTHMHLLLSYMAYWTIAVLSKKIISSRFFMWLCTGTCCLLYSVLLGHLILRNWQFGELDFFLIKEDVRFATMGFFPAALFLNLIYKRICKD
ncbi:MAG: hypothetical protein LBN26_03260 [Christensenellaceae bacterium]|jgi:hypothetical protein|nr:hypothetical protein [Christensenellaceae bacterium]